MNTKVIATLATAAGLVCAANMNAQELTWEVNYGVESEYVFRGVELASESFQGGIEGAYGDYYFGLWGSEAIDSFGKDSTEIDLYGGWGYALNDTLQLDLGGTIYHYPDASDETFELFVGVTADTALAPGAYVFYDFDLEVLTLETSIGHSIAIDDVSSIELGAAVGYAREDAGFNYLYYSATADYVYQISDSTSVAAGLRYSANDEDLGYSPDGNLWGGISFTTSF
ncbi:TorF family putative porin [Pelagicoccus albus]|uniref:Outer membrane protein n=1 Tax=Pelagicoccus albus TaxID=415222 RepID=A0A7X1E9A5_9BACT|nr:TorF family putative porin [Pelagicoccus albus]MBC2605587.1 hypothetical protein [Pelagicoccus albus]